MEFLANSSIEEYYKEVKNPLLRRYLILTENPSRKEIETFPVMAETIDWSYLDHFIKPKYVPHEILEKLTRFEVIPTQKREGYYDVIEYLDQDSERAARAFMFIQYLKDHEKFLHENIDITIAALGSHPLATKITSLTGSVFPTEELGTTFRVKWMSTFRSLSRNRDDENVKATGPKEVKGLLKSNGDAKFDPKVLSILSKILVINEALAHGDPMSLDDIQEKDSMSSEKDKQDALKMVNHYFRKFPESYSDLGQLYEDLLVRAVVRERKYTGI